MGVDTRRRPPLPAPTDSSFNQQSGDDVAPPEFDLATDISRRTDRTSYSIPEDGSPVTIDTTKQKKDKGYKGITHGRNKSQTSLLIEYFEGGKGPNESRRPSVRVKVTPSSHKKGQEQSDHIQITEGKGTRKPSYTRRISLGGPGGTSEQVVENENISVTDSSTVSGRPPIDIEVINKEGSDLSGTSISNRNEEYIPINPSEISSMPPDSMLGGPAAAGSPTPKHRRSRSLLRDDEATVTVDTLKAPSRTRSRSLSRERLTQKVIEKLGKEPRKVSGGKHKSSRSGGVSKEHVETVTSPKRRSGSSTKHRNSKYDDIPSSTEPSLLTASQVSDARSFRSGTSGKSSITNPKLLETVEDAIRRLILPELTELKKEQKTQKNRSNFESIHHEPHASGESAELSRKLSKHASDPNFRSSKPKVVLNRDEHDPGVTLSGDSIKKKKKSRISDDHVYESPSERSFERGMSEETVIRDESKTRKKSKDGIRTRDALAAGLIGGVLTREALKHHDSKSSMGAERRERRRRRSKSHSRSHSQANSVADTAEIFEKADVPPMPMRSELTTSDMTRDSLLSERTSTPTSESRRAEIREVARGSPMQINSPTSSTPTRSPRAKGLDSYYRNDARDDYHYSNPGSPLVQDHQQDYSQSTSTAAAAGLTPGYFSGHSAESFGHGRVLSPIQSVASYEEAAEAPQRDSMHSAASAAYSSDVDLPDHTSRPKGFSLESGQEVLGAHDLRSNPSRDLNHDTWYEHEKGGEFRDSTGNDSYGSKVDVRHLTNYTDDSMDAPYLDKVAAQQIRGVGNNPEYVHTPEAVESAVASLHDSSILDGKSNVSGPSKLNEQVRMDSPSDERYHEDEDWYEERPFSKNEHGSPLKHQLSAPTQDNHTLSGQYDENVHIKSPRQSAAKSIDEYSESHAPVMGASGVPLADDPMPEIGHGLASQKSDISTNPSIIRGPMSSSMQENTWPYNNSPTKEDSANDGLKAAAKYILGAAAAAGAGAALAQHSNKSHEANQNISRDIGERPLGMDESYHKQNTDYIPGDNVYPSAKNFPSSPRDEGYISENPNNRSPALTPDHRAPGGLYSDEALKDIIGKPGPDPFTDPRHARHFSGGSHGMASPLYDSATGRGIDKIQSKDIVALMDHLTVRDAQRNARDTEILVTLVRSAAEMRNSFEDMKRFIQDQDDMVIEVGNKQHEKTQRVIGGPRPQPSSSSRLARGNSADDMTEDIPAQRRNIFRKALKGLGGRSKNDLGKIEDMLHHLLDEVADLKAGQGISGAPAPTATHANGLTSYEVLRDAPQDGYEPEGQAGTSTSTHSGHFSDPSRQSDRQAGYDRRRTSENRVSTVLERDEDDEDDGLQPHEQDILDYENTENMLTPTREVPQGGSVPLGTPPATNLPTGTQSQENTPRTEKSKKGHHKSSSSSFFPKISRWSKTTASSVADNVRGSTQRKERPYSDVSRSGSDLHNYDVNDHYDPHGDDRIRSTASFNTPANDPNRPSSPLVPSSVSDNKYQYHAHRDSINLQHPRPRPGPTAQYLENQVLNTQNFSSPVSPTSDQFGSNPVLARFNGGAGNRNSGGTGRLSPISDAGSTKKAGPPRPPKIADEGPLVPEKVPLSPAQGQSVPRKPTFAERAGNGVQFQEPNGQVTSPGGRTFSGQTAVPSRKPTGPRPQIGGGSGSWSGGASSPTVQRQRYRGSPNHIDSGEDETF